MKITNKHGIPDAFVRAVENDPYDPGRSDYTVTQLIDSPRISILKREHDHEIVVDVMDMIWALFGTAVHYILETSEAEALCEERLYAKAGGVLIGGQFDNLALEESILTDYKVTSVWSVIYGKESWHQQLNLLRWLAEENGFIVKRMEICAILRDWQQSKAKFDHNYPQHQVVRIPIPNWPKSKRTKYINSRIKVFKAAEKKLPLCTDEERWAKPSKWAIMKPGAKRASKVCNSLEEANRMRAHYPKSKIEHRPGAYLRCEGYCDVAKFCKQWQNTRT